MEMNKELIIKAIQARIDIVNWLNNRPHVGLDVTDVISLVEGFDYFGKLLTELTGHDIVNETTLIGDNNESHKILR